MLWQALPEQGGGLAASKKYLFHNLARFHRFSQIVFLKRFANVKCMYCSILHTFAIMSRQSFAIFCKVSQFIVLQSFARFCKLTFRCRECKNHGFPQGFTMDRLLMDSAASPGSLQCQCTRQCRHRDCKTLQVRLRLAVTSTRESSDATRIHWIMMM